MKSLLMFVIAIVALMLLTPSVQACPQAVLGVSGCYTQSLAVGYAQPVIQQAVLPMVQAQYVAPVVRAKVIAPVVAPVVSPVVYGAQAAVVARPGQIRRASRQAVRASLRSSVVVSPVVAAGVVSY